MSEFERVGPEQRSDTRFDVHRVEARLPDGTPDFLLVFRVFYREDKLVETVRGEAYVRTGDRKRRLSGDEKREIRIGKGQIAYEKEPVGLKYPSDFDDLLIDDSCRHYRNKRG